jgi:hypothetical protein
MATGMQAGRELAPGLALKQRGKEWGVVHESSGVVIGMVGRKAEAERFAQLIAPLADWTQDAKALQREELRNAVWDARQSVYDARAAA